MATLISQATPEVNMFAQLSSMYQQSLGLDEGEKKAPDSCHVFSQSMDYFDP